MRYQNADVTLSEIGRALGVAYAVEGSVRRDDDGLTINAQLTAADADERVWSTSLNGPMTDLISMQSNLATAIATQITEEPLPLVRSRNANLNPAAYEAYMKGRHFYNQFTAEGYRRGMIFFQEAIDIEPEYAEAYAGLASCHCLLAGHGLELVSPVIAIPQAHAHAMKALSLDNELAEPIAFLGIIDFKFGWDPESAEVNLRQKATGGE